MAAPQLDRELAQRTVDAFEKSGGNGRVAAKLLGIPEGTFRNRLLRAREVLALPYEPPKPAQSQVQQVKQLVDSVEFDGDKCEITRSTPTQVRTLEDLIAVCDIDTAVWEVERWVANKWEVGTKDPDGNVRVTPLFQVKAWLKRLSGTTLTMMRLREKLVEDIRAEIAGERAPKAKCKYVSGGWLFEFPPFDLHAGKYAWDEETVSNYDVDIAVDLYRAALDFLLEQALKLTGGKLDRILCVFGNDVSHTDNKRGETTQGTRMDVDTRYIRVYRRICEIHRWGVDRLLQVAPVDIVVVPGNHDELTSFHLGYVLETRYENHKHVTVDNGPKLSKYYEYGTNLFGFQHGDSQNVKELLGTMAREVPDKWARCASREWHIGHKHIEELFEARSYGKIDQHLHSDKGVRIRRLMSLSAHDAWHTKHGYMDRRACDGFVFHKTAGFSAQLSFNVDHWSGSPLLAEEGKK